MWCRARCPGQDAIDQLLFLRSMSRRADYGSLRIIAQLDSGR